jgi:HD-like signal output (HDOD) protein
MTFCLPINRVMLEAESKSKYIDAFLNKSPMVLAKMKTMIDETQEFPSEQQNVYRLMGLTNDVSTHSSMLVDYLSKDEKLAKTIVEKAKLISKFKQTRVTSMQLRQSIHRLGFGLIHNEVQDGFAKRYAKVFNNSKNEQVKTLIKKSVRLAYIAKELALMFNIKEANDAFFAGINFHIGEIILALRDERLHNEINKMIERGMDAKAAELAVLGYDLNELSARKLRSWLLNDRIVDIVHNARDPQGVRVNNYKFACLMQFAIYVQKSLDDKKSSPQAMWMKAVEFMTMLDSTMKSDDWVEKIRMMYIKILETEYRIFNAK